MMRFYVVLIWCICFMSSAWSATSPIIQAPPGDKPTEIRITLNINKIFNVQPINESYEVDAYLALEWNDPRAAAIIPTDAKNLVLEDGHVDAERAETWLPTLEIINVIGTRQIANKRLIISENGKIVYNERFTATLTSPMNFRKYPFDSQTFQVVIEPFSYATSKLIFSRQSKVFPSDNAAWPMLEWKVTGRKCQVSEQPYEYLVGSTAERRFANFAFSIDVDRIPDYFVLQIFMPLAIIMLCVWSIWFVRESGLQLSLIFTLMLTVYAFNFFVTGSLPKLPYSTFLGKMISISFIAIFIQMITHLVLHYYEIKISYKKGLLLACLFCFLFIVVNSISWLSSAHAIKHDAVRDTRVNIQDCL